MKKITYVSPEAEFVAISTEDVCTLSLTVNDRTSEEWGLTEEEAVEQGLI